MDNNATPDNAPMDPNDHPLAATARALLGTFDSRVVAVGATAEGDVLRLDIRAIDPGGDVHHAFERARRSHPNLVAEVSSRMGSCRGAPFRYTHARTYDHRPEDTEMDSVMLAAARAQAQLAGAALYRTPRCDDDTMGESCTAAYTLVLASAAPWAEMSPTGRGLLYVAPEGVEARLMTRRRERKRCSDAECGADHDHAHDHDHGGECGDDCEHDHGEEGGTVAGLTPEQLKEQMEQAAQKEAALRASVFGSGGVMDAAGAATVEAREKAPRAFRAPTFHVSVLGAGAEVGDDWMSLGVV